MNEKAVNAATPNIGFSQSAEGYTARFNIKRELADYVLDLDLRLVEDAVIHTGQVFFHIINIEEIVSLEVALDAKEVQ